VNAPLLTNIIRDGLLTLLDSQTVDRLLGERPGLAQAVAIAIGQLD